MDSKLTLEYEGGNDLWYAWRIFCNSALAKTSTMGHFPLSLSESFAKENNGEWVLKGALTFFVFNSDEDLTVFCLKYARNNNEV